MKLEIIDNEVAFVALREPWNQLTAEPLLSWEWNYWCWKHLGKNNRLSIVLIKQDGVIQCIAPFMLETRSGENCLRYIGSGSACTDYAQLVSNIKNMDAFVELIANELITNGGLLSKVSLIELEGVRESQRSSTWLELLESKFWGYQQKLDSTWTLKLPVSWEQFVAQRHKSLRRKIRKAEKRLESGEAIVKSTKENLDFDAAFETLVALHQRRFVSRGNGGVFSDDRFTRFLENATRSLAEQDKAEIAICELDGKPIVAHLSLKALAGPQTYQSGICDLSMTYEPGHLLFTHSIRKAIAEGKTSFDFLRGNEPYKKFWGAIPTPLYTIRCVSNRIPNTFKHQVILGLRHTKDLVRKFSKFDVRSGFDS